LVRAAAFAILLGATPAAASECRLALLLGLDVSTSVDAEEYALQRDGLVAALGAPEVQRAMFSPAGHVAISVFEWSGIDEQSLILPWTRVRDPAALETVRRKIGSSIRSYDDRTALGEALAFAEGVFAGAPADCGALTLDISGDGRSNTGRPPAQIYAELPAYDRILVNGLAVGGELEGVDLYYRDELLHGSGAFLEIANNYKDFERVMRQKLEREMGVFVLGALQ